MTQKMQKRSKIDVFAMDLRDVSNYGTEFQYIMTVHLS